MPLSRGSSRDGAIVVVVLMEMEEDLFPSGNVDVGLEIHEEGLWSGEHAKITLIDAPEMRSKHASLSRKRPSSRPLPRCTRSHISITVMRWTKVLLSSCTMLATRVKWFVHVPRHPLKIQK